jgi:hypothetical protein
VKKIRKALTGALGAAVACAGPLVGDGLTPQDVTAIVAAALLAGLAVYWVPNAGTRPSAETRAAMLTAVDWAAAQLVNQRLPDGTIDSGARAQVDHVEKVALRGEWSA